MSLATIETIERRLARIEKMLTVKNRQVWVGAADVMKVTGWSASDMYRMRKSGAIVFKKMGKSIVYDPNSIPSIFVKQTPSI